MSMTPTNTDLAAALREIADTLPLGSALIVRLAADRLDNYGDPEVLGEHDPDRDPWVGTDGWIEWNPEGGRNCPVPDGTMTEVKFDDGETITDNGPEWWDWGSLPMRQIVAYRIVK